MSTIMKTLYEGSLATLNILYTLPTTGDAKDFVISKFDPIIESSPELRAKVIRSEFLKKLVYSTLLKKIDDSIYFFRGSYAEHAAQTIDADILVVDEVDFQKPDVREMYENRVTGSNSKDIIYWLGTPTLPGYGIDEVYQMSDQREWTIQCPFCKKIQALEWPANVSFKRRMFVCRECRHQLTPEIRIAGRWVPKNPGALIHGYYVSPLAAPWIKAEKLVEQFYNDKPKHFFNYRLGMPYLEKSQQITDDDFMSWMMGEDEYTNLKPEKTIVGIDQGDRFHVTVAKCNKDHLAWVDAMVVESGDSDDEDSASRLERILKSLNADAYVMDKYPDQHFAGKVQKALGKNRCFLVTQRQWGEKTVSQSFMEVSRKDGQIAIDKTDSLDYLFDSLRNRSTHFFYSMPLQKIVLQHLRNIIPDIPKQSDNARRPARKIYKKIGPEDFVHSMNYSLIGGRLFFQELGSKEAPPLIVDSSDDLEVEDLIPGTKPWLAEDFEKRIMEVTSDDNSIIIPVKDA